jgi:hypothetical protein
VVEMKINLKLELAFENVSKTHFNDLDGRLQDVPKSENPPRHSFDLHGILVSATVNRKLVVTERAMPSERTIP